jgi:hypothetical protein
MFSPDYQLIRKEQQAWKKIELDDIWGVIPSCSESWVNDPEQLESISQKTTANL